jgi:hypothetical protein
LTFLALGLGSTTVWAQTLSAFTANGQGFTIFTSGPCGGLTCDSSSPSDCGCDKTTGTITGTDISSGTFVLKDQLLLTEATGNGTNLCYPSSGTLVITLSSGAELKMNFTGPDCKVPNPNWVLLGGGYGITHGTDQFASAIGSGTLSRTKNETTGDTTLSLVGNISLTP